MINTQFYVYRRYKINLWTTLNTTSTFNTQQSNGSHWLLTLALTSQLKCRNRSDAMRECATREWTNEENSMGLLAESYGTMFVSFYLLSNVFRQKFNQKYISTYIEFFLNRVIAHIFLSISEKNIGSVSLIFA